MWTAIGSGLMFVVGIALIPWMLLRMPRDYFVSHIQDRPAGGRRYLVWLLRNLLGLLLVIVGIVLLVFPGQGVLTIVLGLGIAQFPGKYRVLRTIIHTSGAYKSINSYRARHGVAPLILDGQYKQEDSDEPDA